MKIRSVLAPALSRVAMVGVLLFGCAGAEVLGPGDPPAPPPPPPASAQATLYTTLDGPSSVTSPAQGSGGGATVVTTPANDFVPARIGDGLRTDAVGERALLRQIDGGVQNVENDRGTLEFWYKPFYDSDEDGKYTIAGTGTWKANNATRGSIHFGKHNPSNGRMLFLILFDAAGTRWEHNVRAADFGWKAGDWVLVRITWDMTVAPGVRNMHLYLNGQERTLTGEVSFGPHSTLAESANEMIYIGSRDVSGDIPANGLYDEVRIWNQAIPPS